MQQQLRLRPKYNMRNQRGDDIDVPEKDDTQVQQLIRKLVDYVCADTSSYFHSMIETNLGDLGNPFERVCIQIGIELATQYSAALYDDTMIFGPPKKLNQLTCPICHQFKSESRSVICHHLRTPHVVRYRAMQCNICNEVISSRCDVVNHYLIEHKVAPILPPPRRSFDCPFCPYQVTSRQSFSKHVQKCQILRGNANCSHENYQAIELHETFNYLDRAYPPLDELLRGLTSSNKNAPTAKIKKINHGCNMQNSRIQRSDPCNQKANSNPLGLLNRNEMSILGATMQLLEPLLSPSKSGRLPVPEITESLIHQIKTTFMNKPTSNSRKNTKSFNTTRPSLCNGSPALTTDNVNEYSSHETESTSSYGYRHSNSNANLRSVVGHANNVSPLTPDHLLSITELKDIFQENNVYREIDFIVQTLSGLDTRINWYLDTKVSEVRFVAGKCAFCDNSGPISDIVNHYRSAHQMQIKHFQNNRVCVICAAIMPDIRTLLMHQQIVHQMVPMCSTERIIQFHLCKIEHTDTANQVGEFSAQSSNQHSKDMLNPQSSHKQILNMSLDPFHQHDSSDIKLGHHISQQQINLSDSSYLKVSKTDSNCTSADTTHIKQFFCKKCGLTGLDLDELCQHLDDEHSVELRLIQRCDICGEHVRRGKSLSDHNREHLEAASIPVEKLNITEYTDCLKENNITLAASSCDTDCDVIIIEPPDANLESSRVASDVRSTQPQPRMEPSLFQFDEIIID